MSKSKSKKKPVKKNFFSEVSGDVTDFVRTSVFAVLGLVFLGEETIEKLIKDIAKENKLSTKDVDSFIRDVKQQSKIARKDVEKRIEKLIDGVIPSNKKKSGGSKKKSKKKKSSTN